MFTHTIPPGTCRGAARSPARRESRRRTRVANQRLEAPCSVVPLRPPGATASWGSAVRSIGRLQGGDARSAGSPSIAQLSLARPTKLYDRVPDFLRQGVPYTDKLAERSVYSIFGAVERGDAHWPRCALVPRLNLGLLDWPNFALGGDRRTKHPLPNGILAGLASAARSYEWLISVRVRYNQSS
jgi:hypothetical protein